MNNYLHFLLLTWLWIGFQLPLHSQRVVPGAERLEQYLPKLEGLQVGLVVNQSSRIGQSHLIDTLLARGICISRIFAPEHGFRGDAPDGAVIDNEVDQKTGIPVISMYGKNKKPLPEDLVGIDLLIFDMQDVGVRFYTYISTLFYVEEACAVNRIPLLVLDRPNPHGAYIDGPLLENDLKSFIGIAQLPMVHGCTVGELAFLYAGEGFIAHPEQLSLEVIHCEHYIHQTPYTLPTRPSPNLPNQRAIMLYPSLCLFEGTLVSVGRGTDWPFQVYGSPIATLGNFGFTPMPNEGSSQPPQQGQLCIGYNLMDITPEQIFNRRQIDLHYLLDFYRAFPDKSQFFRPDGYFNLLAGTPELRHQMEQDWSEEAIRASWKDGLDYFRLVRRKYLLYEE